MDARETAGITTRLIVAYVRRQGGDDAVGRLLELAGETRPVEDLDDERTWSTYRQKIALFEAASELTNDPWVAYRIGASVLDHRIGRTVRLALTALGSPRQVLRRVARANVRFSTSATMRTIETASGRAVVAYRLHDEHDPSVHDCAYNQGLLSQVSVLFGLPPARIRHPRCQVDGAPECVYEVRWPRWRWWSGRGRRLAERDLDVLHGRISELESTVAELLTLEDLDAVLDRVATRAGVAVHAHRHLLAVTVRGRTSLHGAGLTAAQEQALGAELLETGQVHLHGATAMIVPVASARERYGWLAAFVPEGGGFLAGEEEHLEAYAGLVAGALEITAALASARRSERSKTALLALARRLAQERDEDGIVRRVAEAAPAVVGAQRVVVMRWDPDGQRMITVAARGFDEPADLSGPFAIPFDATPELAGLVADPAPRRYELGCGDPFIDEALVRYGHTAASVAPIVADDELLGLVVGLRIHGAQAPERPERQLDALASLADQAGIALARIRLLESAVHTATHDHLTGLAGRVLFHEHVEQALAEHRRVGRRAAICFVDLDGFKQVNDTHGHAAGDALLREVATRLRRAVREVDTVARMAGDEFALLLRELGGRDDADRIAAALVRDLGRPYDVVGATVEIGASVGVAMLPEDGTSPDALLRAADGAMYAAKRAGGAAHRRATDLATR